MNEPTNVIGAWQKEINPFKIGVGAATCHDLIPTGSGGVDLAASWLGHSLISLLFCQILVLHVMILSLKTSQSVFVIFLLVLAGSMKVDFAAHVN